MNNPEKSDKPAKDKSAPQPPLKPKNPDTKGAPNDKDPEAQYEEKDES
jgi:hypothetical protein